MNDADTRDATRKAHKRAISNLIAYMVWNDCESISLQELEEYADRLESLYDFQAEEEKLFREHTNA